MKARPRLIKGKWYFKGKRYYECDEQDKQTFNEYFKTRK